MLAVSIQMKPHLRGTVTSSTQCSVSSARCDPWAVYFSIVVDQLEDSRQRLTWMVRKL